MRRIFLFSSFKSMFIVAEYALIGSQRRGLFLWTSDSTHKVAPNLGRSLLVSLAKIVQIVSDCCFKMEKLLNASIEKHTETDLNYWTVQFSDCLGLLEVLGIQIERAAGAIGNSSQNWWCSMTKYSFRTLSGTEKSVRAVFRLYTRFVQLNAVVESFIREIDGATMSCFSQYLFIIHKTIGWWIDNIN